MHSSIKTRKSFQSRLRRRAQFLALLLGTIPAANQVFGQSYWTPTNGGNWGTATLWSTDATGGGAGGTPNATRGAVFNITGNNSNQVVFLNGGRDTLGITMNSTGNVAMRANQTGTTVRALTIGADGITVNAGAGILSMITTSGQTNTLILQSQTWTNNSASAFDWDSRLIGHETSTLTKSGTGILTLRGNSSAQNASVNGTTVTGFRGKVVISQGTLVVAQANALGIKDAQVADLTSGTLSLLSDTSVLSGATLDINNISNTNEFVTFQGNGAAGQLGAIVNNMTGTGINNGLSQARMSGDATIGGSTAKFDFRSGVESEGRFFQDGFTLNKTGANIVSFVNTLVQGGGNMNIGQGELRFELSTELMGTGTVTVASGATVGFNNVSGTISRPIVLNAGARLQHVGNDAVSNIQSPITVVGGPATFNVTDNNNATQQGTLNLQGTFTSSSNLIKQGSGRLGVILDPATFTGAEIDIQGGSVDLETVGAGITANITVGESSTAGTIFRPGIGGEGKTSGSLTFNGSGGITNGENRLQFDAATRGPDQHLRVGSLNTNFNQTLTQLKGPASAGTGIVVFESAAGGIDAGEFKFQGRGTLSNNVGGTLLLLDFNPASVVWRGNDATSPTFWDTGVTTNWQNGANPDVFLEADVVTFDDTVGAGSTTVIPINSISPGGIVFNNNAVNYTIGGSTAGVVSAGQVSLTKNGTGTATFATVPGAQGHVIGNTTVNAGVLELAFINPNNAITTAAVTSILGNAGSTTINSGGTLRNAINVNNSGFGTNPTTINAGGLLELTRGSIPNGTNTAPAAAALAGSFSGAGDILLRGVQDTTPLSAFVDTYGAYTINGDNAGFSGRWLLQNSRINVDNGNGNDELGSATVDVAAGAQVLLNGATAVYEGNVFRIAGTGWAFEPTANGAYGALRIGANTATIGSTSSVILTADNTRIGAQNVTGRINAVIDDGANSFNLQIGNPQATQNGNLVLAAANTYGGATNIETHSVMANNNNAFSTGQVNVLGFTSARVTNFAVGNGITISNPINMNTLAGQGGSRGVIEGGRTLQVTDLGAGVGTVAGPVTIQGNQVNTWAHFSSGEGLGSQLRVTGQVTAPAGTIVRANSANVGGYVEFANSNNSFQQFDLSLGTVRLGASNSLSNGVELITRRVADAGGGTIQGVFDMNNFDQTVSHVSRSGTLTNATFNLVNTGTGTSTLTILGTAASDIQNVLAGPNGGKVDIVKNGSGDLVLSGANLGNTGTYTINGGNLNIASGNVAGNVVIANAGTVISGNGTISGAVTLPSGGFTLSAGASPGTLTFGSPIALPNNTVVNWDIVDASTGGTLPPDVPPVVGTPGTSYDQYVFNGGLDLTAVGTGGITVNMFGLASIAPDTQGIVPNFDNTRNYTWMLFDNASLTGFDPAKFAIIDTAFTNNNALLPGASFSVAQLGTDVVLQYTAVPEPSSIILVGCLGLSLVARRSRRSPKKDDKTDLS